MPGSTTSYYYWIDAAANKKCKLRLLKECSGDKTKLDTDGECKAACNANNDNFKKDDSNTCKYAADCTGDKGIKGDGTCAANRAACGGAGALSNYFTIDTNDMRKCKKTAKKTCTDATKKLLVDGTCAAANVCNVSDNY